MGSFPHAKGRAQVSSSRPQAFAYCDRCGFRYNHAKLAWQFQWMGPRLQSTGFLVCPKCMDLPQPQLRPINPGPDPVPIPNPRPFAADQMYEGGPLFTEEGKPLLDENGFEIFPEDYPGPTNIGPLSPDD